MYNKYYVIIAQCSTFSNALMMEMDIYVICSFYFNALLLTNTKDNAIRRTNENDLKSYFLTSKPATTAINSYKYKEI